MINKRKFGIIGLGYVGGAIRDSYETEFVDLIIIDPKLNLPWTYDDIKEAEGIFVCVPSPMGDNGVADTSILEAVLDKLKSVRYDGVIISKVTAPPSVYSQLQEQFPNLVHVPEFLTAANASRDYIEGKFAFIGGKVKAYRDLAENIIREGQRHLKTVVHCTVAEAALTKYTINSYLATKVVFMNELYQLCQSAGIDYKMVSYMAMVDPRIGTSHMRVPGPDGSFGFGGACFPKDTAALLKYAESVGINLNTLESAVKKNTLLRLTESK